RRDQAKQHSQRGRLARSVRAKESIDLALPNPQIQTINRQTLAIDPCQLPGLNRGRSLSNRLFHHVPHYLRFTTHDPVIGVSRAGAVKQLWRSREHTKTGSDLATLPVWFSDPEPRCYGEGVAWAPPFTCVKTYFAAPS